MTERSIVHVLGNAANRPSRVLKEAMSALRHGFADRVVVLALAGDGLPEREMAAEGVEVRRIVLRTRGLPRSLPFQAIKYLEWRRAVRSMVSALSPRIVHAHGLVCLGPSLAATSAPVVFDAHELETEQGQRGLRRILDRVQERRLIQSPHAMLVVSDSIADWYSLRYGIARPVVIRNVPELRMQVSADVSSPLRRHCGIPPDHIVFIYQGLLARGRRLEQFLRVFRRAAKNRHLVIMGYGPMEQAIRNEASRCSNIHFVPAVSPDRVLAYTRDADVGLVGVENTCLSYFFSLPNKLYEYVLAGVPCLAPDWPEIRRTVQDLSAGIIVGDSDDDWTDAVSSIGRGEIARMRADLSRSRPVTWADEEVKLCEVYATLLEPAGA